MLEKMIKDIFTVKNFSILVIILVSFFFLFTGINASITSIKAAGLADNVFIKINGDFVDYNPEVFRLLSFESIHREYKLKKEIGFKENEYLVSNRWFTAIKVIVLKREFDNIKNIKLVFGKKEFEFNKDQLITRLKKSETNIDYTFILSSEEIYSAKSKISKFNSLMNWPGDFEALKLVFFFLLPFLIIILLLIVIRVFIISHFVNRYSINFSFENHRIQDFFIAIFSIGLVIFLLFDFYSGFYGDWYNHLWMIGYNGNYFASNLNFPYTFNVIDNIFYPTPIFYGYLFYPLVGLIGSVLGPNIVLRLFIVILFIIQYYFCWKLFFLISKSRVISNTVSILITWSIYPLTNLYNRCAIPEFAATVLAFISLFIFFILIMSKKDILIKRIKYFFYLFLSVSLCFGTHPITMLYFSITMVIVCILFFPFILNFLRNKSNIIISIIMIIFILIIISPWIYANVSSTKDLNISGSSFRIPIIYDNIDTIKNRFYLILPPVDKRVESSGIDHVSTPYLDTLINIPLLFLIFILVFFKNLKIKSMYNEKNSSWIINFSLVISLLLLIFTSILSLNNKMYELLPKFSGIIQICYRIVTYQNIALLLLIIIIFSYYKLSVKNKAFLLNCIFIITTLAFASILIKIDHILPVKEFIQYPEYSFAYKFMPEKKEFLKYPETVYSFMDYTSNSIPELDNTNDLVNNKIIFKIKENPFGRIEQPISINVKKSKWFLTNIAKFSWNKIYLDEKLIDIERIKSFKNLLTLYISEGNHSLKVDFVPPPEYNFLRAISLTLLVISFFVLIGIVSVNIFNFFIKKGKIKK